VSDPEFLYKKALVCESRARPRLDAFLARALPELSRSYVKDLIQAGLVTIDGEPGKPSTKLSFETKVVLRVPQPKDAGVQAENIPLDICYQDQHLAVVVKPRGMLSHPAPGKYQGTLVNALLHHLSDLSGINGELRPGIVHRLDRDTSGVMVVAKHDEAHRELQTLFRERSLTKRYLALVSGRLAQKRGLIDIPIGRHPHKRFQMAAVATGKEARSEFRALQTYGDTTLVAVRIYTGRTHQIRVHMAHLGHPVVGDTMYGNRKDNRFPGGFALHAWHLEFDHPFSGERMRFYEPLPEDMRAAIGRFIQEEKDGYL
jgi:23S rRNA pseudouridine1911/1915/1917 synthase